MYVTVRYGNDKCLICNPHCAVINFMNNLRHKSGYLDSSLDLCDETGLIRDLDQHRMEYANKYLANAATYILIEKENAANSKTSADVTDSLSRRFTPLLDRYEELLPNFRLRHKKEEEAIEHRKLPSSKSNSPAGKFQRKKRSKFKNSESESPRKSHSPKI